MKKKKIFAFAAMSALLGCGLFSAANTNYDSLIPESDKETTYIVKVAGDLKKDEADVLEKNRNEVLNQINYLIPKDEYKINFVYGNVYNGFSITVNSAYKDAILSIAKVTGVQKEHVYALPEDDTEGGEGTTTDESIKEMKMANYSAETMHATAEEVKAALMARGASESEAESKLGRGIRIGIMDTGLYYNQVAGTARREQAIQTASVGGYTLNAPAFEDLSEDDAIWTSTQINAAHLSHDYFSFNNKIPYAYDYVGNDTDVDPTASGSEHGTHVASLASANGTDFKGIAPNAQLGIFKVFGDDQGGATTSSIIAAIEDATKLKMDVINLSLGSDLMDYECGSDDAQSVACQAAKDAGVIVNFSAGNSGKSSFSGTKGYADFTTEQVETSTIGSYALLDETCNIVASSNPDKAFYDTIMKVKQTGETNESAVSFSDQIKNSTTQTFDDERFLSDLIPAGEESTTVEYVSIPGLGAATDYDGINCTGKVAVVNRGDITFVAKVTAAQAAGATAMICINNDPSVTFNFTMAFSDMSPRIPVVMVFQNTKTIFGQSSDKDHLATGTIKIAKNAVESAADGNVNSSFSTEGSPYNLDFGPTITAPGTSVMGAISAGTKGETSGLYGYDNLSGTSMSSPNYTGALALALSEYKPDNDGYLATSDDTAFTEYKKKLSSISMSTSDPLTDTSSERNVASPRLQGAGRVDVAGILESESYVTSDVDSADLEGFKNTTQAKVELKNNGSLFVDGADFSKDQESYIEFDYTIHNDSNVARTYTPKLQLMIPQLRIQITHKTYQTEVETDSTTLSEVIGYSEIEGTDFVATDPDTYPKFVGDKTVSINDDIVDLGDHQLTGSIDVAANSTYNGKVKVRIDNLHFEKDFNDGTFTENFSGTLKEYYNEYFSEAGGNFVEGFLTLEESTAKNSTTLRLPYMGFYGDYTVGKAVEEFDFEKEDRKTYASDLVSNYMKNLSSTYARPDAYAGSTLSASSSGLSASTINKIGDFQTSAKVDGSTYLSVSGDTDNGDTKLYAGAKGVSDHLIAMFFVYRSMSSAKWYVKNGSKVVKSGDIADVYYYNNSYTTTTQLGLVKSCLTANDTGYEMHRGYADIDLSKVDEGEYTLEFEFNLRYKDTVQTKSYDLVVDKTAPELVSVEQTENDGNKYLTVTGKGADSTMTLAGTRTVISKKVSGSDDEYYCKWSMRDEYITNDRVLVQLEDYAHNTRTLVYKPSMPSVQVSYSSFTNRKGDFNITCYSTKGNKWSYEVSLTDNSGNDLTLTSGYDIYLGLQTGLNADDIVLSIDGEDVESPDYDATTGILVIHMNKDSATFSVNKKPLLEGTSDDSNNNKEEEKSSGCGGSIITATSLGAGLMLIGLGLALKKKREE